MSAKNMVLAFFKYNSKNCIQIRNHPQLTQVAEIHEISSSFSGLMDRSPSSFVKLYTIAKHNFFNNVYHDNAYHLVQLSPINDTDCESLAIILKMVCSSFETYDLIHIIPNWDSNDASLLRQDYENIIFVMQKLNGIEVIITKQKLIAGDLHDYYYNYDFDSLHEHDTQPFKIMMEHSKEMLLHYTTIETLLPAVKEKYKLKKKEIVKEIYHYIDTSLNKYGGL